MQELARVSGQRFDIAALAFRVQGVEGQRRLAGAGQAGNHDQLIARQIEIDILEVMRASAANADLFHVIALLSVSGAAGALCLGADEEPQRVNL